MRRLPAEVSSLAARQGGVVTRGQLLGTGADPAAVRAWLHHRLLAPVHPGVYVTHTGAPTRRQQEWAAVLYAAPAALSARSALLAHDPRLRLRADGPVSVAIDVGRRLRMPPPGIEVRRMTGLVDKVHPTATPPRLRVEEAALDVAAEAATEADAVAVLAQVLSARLTTAGRLDDALRARPRIARRQLLESIVDDLAHGACSVLERAYLRDVERAHGLPTAARQVRASARGTIWRDVGYVAYGLVVELDGRLDHTDVHDRARDLDRDLDAAVDGRRNVRLGHTQVLSGACTTAVRIAQLLRAGGWDDSPRRCPRCS